FARHAHPPAAQHPERREDGRRRGARRDCRRDHQDRSHRVPGRAQRAMKRKAKRSKPARAPAVRFETAAVHAGQQPEPITGAVMTPVFLTSTFAQRGPGQHTGFEYSRTQNPTRFALEANLAALEGGAWGLAFNAGVAASAAVLAMFDAGEHVVAGDDIYGGSY